MFTQGELEILPETFLFRGMAAEEIDKILSGLDCALRCFPKGALIYSPTDFRRELGILLAGRILVTKGALTVSELVPADLFGAAALFTDEERYVSTLTCREKCRILFLSQTSVSRLLERDARIRENYIRYLAQRIRFLSAKVDALAGRTGSKKLTAYLLRQTGEDGRLTVRSMTELASRLGISRASLYRELAKLQDAGIVSHSGKTIVLLKPELLG